jgi:membrane AbrB-like protein
LTEELRRWWPVLALTVFVAAAMQWAGLPSPALFGALVSGIVVACVVREPALPPPAAVRLSQSVIGVTVGCYVQLPILVEVLHHAAPILVVTAATLVLSILAGIALSRWQPIGRTTAVFGMIAGGASGLTAISRELGADDGLVALMQYARVLLILATMPAVVALAFSAPSTNTAVGGTGSRVLAGLALTAVCVPAGRVVARLARLPVGSLLGPLVVAAVVVIVTGSSTLTVPVLVQDGAYAVIGLQAGLRCSPARLRAAGTVLRASVLLTCLVMLACAGLGIVLSAWIQVSALDGYLATTPGGLYAVLATANQTGSNTTLVLSVQVLRLVVMLVCAPLIAARLGPDATPGPAGDRDTRTVPSRR